MDDAELARSLGRVEGKVDTILDLLTEDRARIHAVEKKVWYSAGVSAVLAAVAVKLGLPLPH